MDMGVIHAIKCLYRVRVARKLLALIETKQNLASLKRWREVELYLYQ